MNATRVIVSFVLAWTVCRMGYLYHDWPGRRPGVMVPYLTKGELTPCTDSLDQAIYWGPPRKQVKKRKS